MAHQSHPRFRTFHALRIKGFAQPAVLAEIAGLGEDEVTTHLQALLGLGYVQFREARGLWQLTPDGRVAHAKGLAEDIGGLDLHEMRPDYHEFVRINERFKVLCGDWQLRNGEINDHTDAAHDQDVLAGLVRLDEETHPRIAAMSTALTRLAPYSPRLTAALGRLQAGDIKQFTGVMCNSYHDVWMELHEDLILSQGIDRAAEGSF